MTLGPIKPDLLTMSFIDSQKFSPICSVIDDESLEGAKATKVFEIVQEKKAVTSLVTVQDDFEAQSSPAKNSKQRLEAHEMFEIIKRLETEQQDRPKLKLKSNKLNHW